MYKIKKAENSSFILCIGNNNETSPECDKAASILLAQTLYSEIFSVDSRTAFTIFLIRSTHLSVLENIALFLFSVPFLP